MMNKIKHTIILILVTLTALTVKAQQPVRILDDAIDKKLEVMLKNNLPKLKGQNNIYMLSIRFSLSRKNGIVAIDSITTSSPEESKLLFLDLTKLSTLEFAKGMGNAKKLILVKPVIVYVLGQVNSNRTYTMTEVLNKGLGLLDDKHNGKKYQPEDMIYEKRILQPFLMLFDLNEYY